MSSPLPKLIRITTVPMALKHLLAGQMRYMSENGFEVIMVSAAGKEINDIIVNEGCPHHIINMTRSITPLSDLKSLWQLYRFFKKEKPAIVHSHTPKAGLLAMVAAKFAGVKIRIHTIAGLRFMTSAGFTRKILVFMEKLTSNAATHVWPNSFSLLKYVEENKLVPKKKLQVIGTGSSNGIDPGRFGISSLQLSKLEEIKKQLGYSENLTYLLSVGRIVKDKGINELLIAFDKLYAADNKLRLVLLGSFEEELDPLSDEAKKILKEHPGIIHINWSDEVEYYMHLAFLLVHPSYREGLPNVLLQAGAMGCPVVCSRIQGNIDIVDDRITGIIFEAGNEIDLTEKLTFALHNRGLLKNYAVVLQKKIMDNFDRQFIHRAIKTRYFELLSEQTN
jgi:glycosyltransferase involved in cell wall biosynthesis